MRKVVLIGYWLMLLLVAFPGATAALQAVDSAEPQVVEIRIDGVSGVILENIKSALRIYQLHGQAAPPQFRLRYLMGRGEQQLADLLQAFGYYRPSIASELRQDATGWRVHYQIELGPLVTITALDLQIFGDAEHDPLFAALLEAPGLAIDSAFDHGRYEQLKAQLRSLAAERGYYNAQFSQQRVDIELTALTASITLHFDSGPRYRFGPLTFCCSPLSDSLLQRFQQFRQGDPFATRDLLDLQVALAGSDYFSNIEIAPQWQAIDRSTMEVPVTVSVTENLRDKYQFGAGFGTDTGARLSVGFDRRWVNQEGHQLSSLIRFSEIQTTGIVSYHLPGQNPAQDRYSMIAEISDRSFEQQRATLYRARLSDVRHYDDWQRTYQLSWQREDFAFGSESTRSTSFLVPSADFSLIRSQSATENRHLIDDGYRLTLHLQGASRQLASDTTFLSARLSGKWVQPLTAKWRLLLQGELGAMEVKEFDQLAPSLRFFAGGDHSVRGYAYQQLGDTNAEGVVIGGKYLTTASIEFDYLWREQWRIAVFSDFGQASSEWPQQLKQSVGVGVRWLSPIGPIRFDVAQALDEPDKPWRIHLTVGPDL